MPHPSAKPAARASGPALALPLRLFGIGACVVVLLVALVGLAGGLEPAEAEPLPAVAVDEMSEGQPWNVAVARAILFTELEPSQLGDPDRHHWLAVVAEVAVTAPESRADAFQVLSVAGVDGLVGEELAQVPGAVRPDDIRIVRDTTPVVALHPGLTERVVFLWERANDAPTPAEIEVWIIGLTQSVSTISGYPIWLDPQPRARVTVPLEDQRERP